MGVTPHPAAAAEASFAQAGPVRVAVCGYLVGGHAGMTDRQTAADTVLQRYLAAETSGVEQLDGSFVILLADQRRDLVHAWTDPCGTRPMFWTQTPAGVRLAPEVKCLLACPDVPRTLQPGAPASMLLNAALIDETTYFQAVRLLGPARHLRIENGRCTLRRYWRRRFRTDPDARPPTADELAGRVAAATADHLGRFRRPALALSGGLDSRLILAAVHRLGMNIEAVTWGTDHVDDPDGDHQTALRVAERLGVSGHSMPCGLENFLEQARRAVRVGDGLSGHLGAQVQAAGLAPGLTGRYDAVAFGNQLFDGGSCSTTRAAALSNAGLHFGRDLHLIRLLMRPEHARAAIRDLLAWRAELIDSPDGPPAPNDLKDVLYWQTRLPRLITSQAAVYRRHLAYAAPLLDLRVVALDAACTPRQRSGKQFIARTAAKAFPEAFRLPLARRHSRTDWRRQLREDSPLRREIFQTLMDPLAAFDEWFDRDAIAWWLARYPETDRRRLRPAGRGRLSRLALEARGRLAARELKPRRLISLLNLKLWFELFA